MEDRSLDYRQDLESAVNRNSIENGSDTPDFIIAEFLADCTAALDKAIKRREKWYGRNTGEGAAVLGDVPSTLR